MTSVYRNLYINGNGFVFDYNAGLTCNLNPTGTFILRELLQGTPLTEINHAIESKFGISHRTATSDIEDFIQQLSSLDLLESNGGSAR